MVVELIDSLSHNFQIFEYLLNLNSNIRWLIFYKNWNLHTMKSQRKHGIVYIYLKYVILMWVKFIRYLSYNPSDRSTPNKRVIEEPKPRRCRPVTCFNYWFFFNSFPESWRHFCVRRTTFTWLNQSNYKPRPIYIKVSLLMYLASNLRTNFKTYFHVVTWQMNNY